MTCGLYFADPWFRGKQNGLELGQTSRDGEGQGGLVCCSLWGHKELDMTEQLNDGDDSCGSPKSSLSPEEQEDAQDGHL